MNDTRLHPDQIEYFKLNGILILRGLLDEGTVRSWREQIWSSLDSALEAQCTWPTNIEALEGFEYKPSESAFALNPVITGITRQLGGGDFVVGEGVPIIKWPDPDGDWRMPQSGHLDAYGKSWMPFMLGATTYLYDVAHAGGAFVYWPGSHRTAHRYFRRFPDTVDGSFLDDGAFNWDVFCQGGTNGPQEFIGNAGDVILWHSYLTHTGSANIRNRPRIALFARFDHRRRSEKAFRYDVPGDLWEHWAI